MGLNIKNTAAEDTIRELAELTGEGLTDAVLNAAREKIDRIRAKREQQTYEEFIATIRPLQEAVARERADNGDTRTSRQLMDELYDEHGLPK